MVLATSILVIVARKNVVEDGENPWSNLAQVLYIRYPVTIGNKSVPMSVLFHLGSKVNAIYTTFAKELGVSIRPTDVGVQKIDGTACWIPMEW